MAIVFQTPEIVQKLLLNAKSLQIEHKHITVIQMVCNKCCWKNRTEGVTYAVLVAISMKSIDAKAITIRNKIVARTIYILHHA